VGDAQFQRKCLGKMSDVARGGRTVLFVSHNMGAVGQLCRRGLVLGNGEKQYEGPVAAAVDWYLSHAISASGARWTRPGEPVDPLTVLEAWATDEAGQPRDRFDLDDTVVLHLRYRVTEKLRGTNLALILSRNGNEVFCSFDTDSCPDRLEGREVGDHTYRIALPRRLLKAGMYGVTLAAGSINKEAYEIQRDVLAFHIEELSEDTTSRGYNEGRPGMLIAPVRWSDG
jgi:lipopolysaccharide transport system ATP-binding protein